MMCFIRSSQRATKHEAGRGRTGKARCNEWRMCDTCLPRKEQAFGAVMAFWYEGETAAERKVIIIYNGEETSRALARSGAIGSGCRNGEQQKRCEKIGDYGEDTWHNPPPRSLYCFTHAHERLAKEAMV